MTNEMKTKQVSEGVERMRMLRMMRQPIREFEKYGKLNLSENGGFLYWLEEPEREMVANFEEENDATVYHVIKSVTTFGTMYSLMYVSKYEEEWEQDRDDIKNGMALAYVVNVDMPDCSEFGSIGIAPSIGGVRRTW